MSFSASDCALLCKPQTAPTLQSASLNTTIDYGMRPTHSRRRLSLSLSSACICSFGPPVTTTGFAAMLQEDAKLLLQVGLATKAEVRLFRSRKNLPVRGLSGALSFRKPRRPLGQPRDPPSSGPLLSLSQGVLPCRPKALAVSAAAMPTGHEKHRTAALPHPRPPATATAPIARTRKRASVP